VPASRRAFSSVTLISFTIGTPYTGAAATILHM